MTIHDRSLAIHVVAASVARRAQRLSDKGLVLEVGGLDAPTPATVCVLQVQPANEPYVLGRLIRSEMSDETPVAERGGVSVEHQHAAGVGRACEQLTPATVGVGVSREWTAGEDRRAQTPVCRAIRAAVITAS
jgi:hypothetical protein